MSLHTRANKPDNRRTLYQPWRSYKRWFKLMCAPITRNFVAQSHWSPWSDSRFLAGRTQQFKGHGDSEIIRVQTCQTGHETKLRGKPRILKRVPLEREILGGACRGVVRSAQCNTTVSIRNRNQEGRLAHLGGLPFLNFRLACAGAAAPAESARCASASMCTAISLLF